MPRWRPRSGGPRALQHVQHPRQGGAEGLHRLQQFKRDAGKGKTFGVLGCVAQQEGERIFEKAPHVSMVVGSASYTKLPELLVQLEAGNRRVTGLSLDTDDTFETPFTRRDNPHRAYITIIEGCDKAAPTAWCRSRADPSAAAPARACWRRPANSPASGYTEIQLLGQNVNSYRDPSPAGWNFAHAAGSRRAASTAFAAFGFTTSHPRDFAKDIIDAIDRKPSALQPCASAGAIRVSSTC